MSDAPRDARSFEKIELADLQRLAEISFDRIVAAFARSPDKEALYKNALLGHLSLSGRSEPLLKSPIG